jgi:hypothetical protein
MRIKIIAEQTEQPPKIKWSMRIKQAIKYLALVLLFFAILDDPISIYSISNKIQSALAILLQL